MRKIGLDWWDIFIALGLGVIMFCAVFFLFGFAKIDISYPITYAGGDDFTTLSTIKGICENGWFWENDKLGAPFGATAYDFKANFLQNADFLITKLIHLFINNPIVVYNIQILFIFFLCAANAYIALRLMKIEKLPASFGSVLFSFSPYISMRIFMHFCLASCYFVPFSILLCYWMIDCNPRYLCRKGFWSNPQNILTIIFAVLIANNGIAYYPFFTCFFLVLIAVYELINTRKIDVIIKPLLVIMLICILMLILLIPSIAYIKQNGNNNITQRSFSEAEIYSLKIAQFFIPNNGHGISIIDKIINRYNSNMPLVNENMTAYLGFGAIIGFLLSLYYFLCHKNGKNMAYMYEFSIMNIGAILFFSIGGFISLLCVLTGISALRGFNRISIFIEFICIFTLCYALQTFWIKASKRIGKAAKYACYIILSAFAVLCIWELHPSYSGNLGLREFNADKFKSDDQFISLIETKMRPGDSIFQLPYHKYPEAGPVNNMADYHLLTGYIHSKKLKWSYGGTKGRESDKWNEVVSSLPVEMMVKSIIPYGFRGIYIDLRAYSKESWEVLELKMQNAIGEKALVSSDGSLAFYDLYPYIAKYPETLALEKINTNYYPYNSGNEILFYSDKYNANYYFTKGLSQREKDFVWSEGKECKIQMKLINTKNAKIAEAKFKLAFVFNGRQKVIAIMNNETVFNSIVQDGENLEFKFRVPSDGIINLTLKLPDAISPGDLHPSKDPRQLGIAFKELKIMF